MKRVPFLDLASIHRPNTQRFTEAFQRFLAAGHYILGPELEGFESEFSALCGVPHAVGVANGLDALRLALQVLDVGQGDEVIVPAHTFIATWLAVSAQGATPVPVDVVEETGNINPALIEDAISPRTRAIMPVHLHGIVAPMHDIQAIASRHGLSIIEDAAQAHGARLSGKPAGSFGVMAGFSFYPGKNLGALGDGGAITCANEQMHQRLLRLRNYGSSRKYHHEEPGLNSRLDELQAAFLRIRLATLEHDNALRRRQASRYHEAFAAIPALQLLNPGSEHAPAWHLYVVRCADRDALRSSLDQAGIDTLVHYPVPPHRQSAYAAYAGLNFPVAEAFARNCLSLPIGPHLDDDALDRVINAVRNHFII